MAILMSRFQILRLLNLRGDQADNETIDATIRGNAGLAGTNLWVLMFAIMIASVGLNVNSTAVIIGAMLISPLMGPIIGIGYGASIHDDDLIRQCLRTLLIFISISLCVSTLYFLVSPLGTARSELLARTTPNIWDVLIAFFGGAAGMVGLTRKEKTTLIPGVAIATALMPPICTAGYGLATGQPKFFFGAFFLFLINAVFIALATLAIARILRLPEHKFADEATRRRGRRIIGAAIVLTVVPSIYFAYGLVREELFLMRAQKFVGVALAEERNVSMVRRAIDPADRVITLTLLGRGVTPELEARLRAKQIQAGVADARLIVEHPSEASAAGHDLLKTLEVDAQQAARDSAELALRLARLEQQGASVQAQMHDYPQIEAEIAAQYPGVRKVRVAAASAPSAGSAGTHVLVVIDSTKPLPKDALERLRRWLKVRLPETVSVELVIGKLQ